MEGRQDEEENEVSPVRTLRSCKRLKMSLHSSLKPRSSKPGPVSQLQWYGEGVRDAPAQGQEQGSPGDRCLGLSVGKSAGWVK